MVPVCLHAQQHLAWCWPLLLPPPLLLLVVVVVSVAPITMVVLAAIAAARTAISGGADGLRWVPLRALLLKDHQLGRAVTGCCSAAAAHCNSSCCAVCLLGLQSLPFGPATPRCSKLGAAYGWHHKHLCPTSMA
jgi:hypothetical protein